MKTVKFLSQSATATFMIAAISFTGCKKDNDPVSVSGVSLNKPVLTLTEGDSETLTATVTSENAENKTVVWASDKTDIAIVDAEGKVTAIAVGTADITVTTKDGSKTATCTVTVDATTVSVPSASITGIAAPVAGEAPNTAINHGESYSTTLSGWADEDGEQVEDNFAAGTVYRAVVTLTPRCRLHLRGFHRRRRE